MALTRSHAKAASALGFLAVFVLLAVSFSGCGDHPTRPEPIRPGLIGYWSDGTTEIYVYVDSTAYCSFFDTLYYSPCGVKGPQTVAVQGGVFHDSGVGVEGEDDEFCGLFGYEGHTRFSAVLDPSQTHLAGSIEYTRYSACNDPSCIASDTHVFFLAKRGN